MLEKIIGIKDVDSLQLKIKDKVKNNILPSTMGLFDIDVVEMDGKNVIKIMISSGPEKPYYLKEQGMSPDGCFIRVGSSKEKLTQREIDSLYSRRIRNSLKELESPRQELTFNQLKIYYEEHNLKLGKNFLKNLDLLTSEGKFNYNAFLLADENNIPIPVVKYYGTTKVELEENEDYGNRCLITATQRILGKLESENRTYAKIHYYGRDEVEMIDTPALKEAIINAIVHNDYSYGQSPIIELYSDRLEITSAGGLPLELSEESFFEGTVYRRNKELIKIFKDVELIENIGSGVRRILEVYDKDCFKFMDNYLRVIFKYRENPFEYKDKGSELETGKKTGKKTSKKPSEDDILNFCRESKSLKEIALNFGYKDIDTFKNNYLKPLIDKKLLQMTIPEQPRNRNQKYIRIDS